MKVELGSAANLDVLEIMEYYDEAVDAVLAADFYAEFWRVVDRIAEWPQSFPIHVKDYRRANLSRFPYNILYRIVEDETVRILAVRHPRRHPPYGTRRR